MVTSSSRFALPMSVNIWPSLFHRQVVYVYIGLESVKEKSIWAKMQRLVGPRFRCRRLEKKLDVIVVNKNFSQNFLTSKLFKRRKKFNRSEFVKKRFFSIFERSPEITFATGERPFYCNWGISLLVMEFLSLKGWEDEYWPRLGKLECLSSNK